MADNLIIEVEDLSVVIDGKKILSEISFSVSEGDFLSIIGPNGAGKTTLLKLLAGIINPRSGKIKLAGKEMRERTIKEHARLVSYVPQAGGRNLPFTVSEFVLMGRYPHLSPFSLIGANDKEKVSHAMEITGVTEFAGRIMGTLSGGERQKAFIAAALCQDAKIILLDEPTAFLDPKHQDEIQKTLYDINRERGVTVLSVTHDINAAADERINAVLALKNGFTGFFGSVNDLMQKDVLREIYEKDFTIAAHPESGRPVVFP